MHIYEVLICVYSNHIYAGRHIDYMYANVKDFIYVTKICTYMKSSYKSFIYVYRNHIYEQLHIYDKYAHIGSPSYIYEVLHILHICLPEPHI